MLRQLVYSCINAWLTCRERISLTFCSRFHLIVNASELYLNRIQWASFLIQSNVAWKSVIRCDLSRSASTASILIDEQRNEGTFSMARPDSSDNTTRVSLAREKSINCHDFPFGPSSCSRFMTGALRRKLLQGTFSMTLTLIPGRPLLLLLAPSLISSRESFIVCLRIQQAFRSEKEFSVFLPYSPLMSFALFKRRSFLLVACIVVFYSRRIFIYN